MLGTANPFCDHRVNQRLDLWQPAGWSRFTNQVVVAMSTVHHEYIRLTNEQFKNIRFWLQQVGIVYEDDVVTAVRDATTRIAELEAENERLRQMMHREGTPLSWYNAALDAVLALPEYTWCGEQYHRVYDIQFLRRDEYNGNNND